MLLIVLGLILWTGGHLWNRFLPGPYANLGSGAKGISALIIFSALALMIFGYRGAETINVWYPPHFFRHINNLLMLFAVFTYFATLTPKGTAWLVGNVKNPQLTGFKIWAVAHLLVNGDLASILLFGGLIGWAVWEVILIKRQGEKFDASKAPIKSPIVHLIVSLVLFGIISGIHVWLGVNPFG